MRLDLTLRDRNTLTLLYYNRFMHVGQIAELFYKYDDQGILNKTREELARARIRKMIKNKLVKEYVPYARQRKVYALDDDGVSLVCSWIGAKYENYAKRENILNMGLMEHSLEINDFYINLSNYCRDHSYTIKTFQVERHNRRAFTHNKQSYTFQPDIFFIITNATGKGKVFYAELDRGTEAPKKFAKKVINYEAFYHQELQKEDWNNQNIRPDIIVLCDNKNRLERLQEVTKSILKWRFILKDDIGGIFMANTDIKKSDIKNTDVKVGDIKKG
jgi:hypothetical protein